MMKGKYLLLMLLVVLMQNCDIRDNKDIVPEHQFVKVFDRNDFSSSLSALDIQELPEGGYMVLGQKRVEDYDFLGTYLMKTDEIGDFMIENDLSETYAHPVGELIYLDGSLYFFAMSPTSLETFLVQVDTEGNLIQSTGIGLTYPQFAKFDNGSFLLLSYDHLSKESVLSIVGIDGSISASSRFSIGAGEDVEAPIINHFTRTGKKLPFYSGKTSDGLYFFNGFFNYTLSLVFTNLSSDDPVGVVQGQRSQGGLSSTLHISGNTFAVSRFNFGDNYILPQTTLETNGTTASSDLGGFSIPELTEDAGFVVKDILVNQQNYTLFASDTKNRQIVIYAYDESTGELRGSEYLGFSNPFELASFTLTSDGGLIIAGTTYVSGRFPRISLYKLSSEDVNSLVSQISN